MTPGGASRFHTGRDNAFDLSLVADLRAFVVAAGALDPENNEEGFRLLLVDASSSPWAVAEVMPNQ